MHRALARRALAVPPRARVAPRRSAVLRRWAVSRARQQALRLNAAAARSLREAFETPRVSALQHGGAAVLLYAYSETDIVWLRFWTLGGILLSSFLPHAINGNPLFGAWASLFVGINAYRLWGLASERAPVVLDDDEFACYEGSGLARFVHPRCFRRLAAEGRFETLAPNTVQWWYEQ